MSNRKLLALDRAIYQNGLYQKLNNVLQTNLRMLAGIGGYQSCSWSCLLNNRNYVNVLPLHWLFVHCTLTWVDPQTLLSPLIPPLATIWAIFGWLSSILLSAISLSSSLTSSSPVSTFSPLTHCSMTVVPSLLVKMTCDTTIQFTSIVYVIMLYLYLTIQYIVTKESFSLITRRISRDNLGLIKCQITDL